MSRLELEVVTRFLYTDEASLPVSLAPPGWLAVLELANRLVLPRLVTLLEREAISSLGARLEAGAEVTILGWGKEADTGGVSPDLNYVQVPCWCSYRGLFICTLSKGGGNI